MIRLFTLLVSTAVLLISVNCNSIEDIPDYADIQLSGKVVCYSVCLRCRKSDCLSKSAGASFSSKIGSLVPEYALPSNDSVALVKVASRCVSLAILSSLIC